MKIKVDGRTLDKICIGYRYDYHNMRSGNKLNLRERILSIVKAINRAGLENVITCEACKDAGGHYEDVAGDGGSHMWIDCEECGGITCN